jgi:hemerythrin superfamily protein
LATAFNKGWDKVRDVAAAVGVGNARGDALDLLTRQHREVEKLFARIEKARKPEKRRLFSELANQLAIHATIEERHFYPAVRTKETEDLVLESFEEHMQMKRVIADLLKQSKVDETFDAKITLLKEEVRHHAKEEEEAKLFPKVRKLLDDDRRLRLGQEMATTVADLERNKRDLPRQVLAEVEAAAPM